MKATDSSRQPTGERSHSESLYIYCLLALLLVAAGATAHPRPNVILVMADYPEGKVLPSDRD